ncbi:MAG: hypothetical protein KGP29_01270 [Proteobacteria bacterium]|nr:hypothetical protein [Pseudomonadota bacterium]
MKKNQKKLKAFSLVELSVVILIVSIVIEGITSASRLVYQSRINSARFLTISSPINGIKDLLVWFESTSDASFAESEKSDLAKITNWHDINPQQPFKYVLNQPIVSRQPTYEARGASGGLPLVQFYSIPTAAQSMSTTGNIDLVGNPSFTMFFVASAGNNSEAKSRLFSIGNTSGACTQFDLSYWGNNLGNLRFNGGDKTFPMLNSNMLSVFRIVRDSVSGNSTVNGSSTAIYFNGAAKILQNRATEDCSPYLMPSPLSLNPDVPPNLLNWTVKIAEIVIFNRVLKSDEIRDIEAYLSKKWSIKLDR